MRKPESEERGGRLLVGYVIMAIGAIWLYQGYVWLPFSERLVNTVAPNFHEHELAARQLRASASGAGGTFAGPISDIYAILSAIAYVIGAFTLRALVLSWDGIGSFLSATRQWTGGAKQITEAFTAHREQPNVVTPNQTPVAATSSTGIQNRLDAGEVAALNAELAKLKAKVNQVVQAVNKHDKQLTTTETELARLDDVKSNRRGK